MSEDVVNKNSVNPNRFAGRLAIALISAFALFILFVPSLVAIPLGWILGDASVILGPATFTVSCTELSGSEFMRNATKFDRNREVFVQFLLLGRCPVDPLAVNDRRAEGDHDNDTFGQYNDTYAGLKPFWGDDIVGHYFENFGKLVGRGYEDGVRSFGPQFITYISAYGGFRFFYWAFMYSTAVILTAFLANFGTTISKNLLGSPK